MDRLRRLICRIFGHDFIPMVSGGDVNSWCERCRRMFLVTQDV